MIEKRRTTSESRSPKEKGLQRTKRKLASGWKGLLRIGAGAAGLRDETEPFTKCRVYHRPPVNYSILGFRKYRRRYIQNPNSGHQSQLALQFMDMLGLSNSAQRDDEYYREQWRLYYAERQRLLMRMFWIAGGLGVFFLLFIAVIYKHPTLGNVLAVPGAILLLALPAQWFLFVWRIGGWTCPQCGEYFFSSTFVRNPFGRCCRHCGLARPKESEIDHFHYENEGASPQVTGE
jgi:hypothetical protein